MVDVTENQFAAAEARGREMLKTEARAARAVYDRTTERVLLDLVSGCTYGFPTRIIEDLQGAEAEALAEIQVDGMGLNLHWPRLDVDLYVPSLVAGVFGSRAWMARLSARTARLPPSPVRTTGALSNGAKSNRPRKLAQG